MHELSKRIFAFGAKAALGTDTVLCMEAMEELELLMDGNTSYLSTEQNRAQITQHHRTTTAQEGQKPFAAVVCCSDSRMPPEHIFHVGLGKLFVIRNAGNLMGPFDVGSVEYAVEHLGVRLVLLMGHRGCGAVASALAKAKERGSLAALVEEVTLAIGDTTDPREAERRNLLHSMEKLQSSETLRACHEAGEVEFAAAIYDIHTGEVEFLTE